MAPEILDFGLAGCFGVSSPFQFIRIKVRLYLITCNECNVMECNERKLYVNFGGIVVECEWNRHGK